MKITQAMVNAFLNICQGERLRSAPPNINTQHNIITNPVVSYEPHAQAQSGRNVLLGD
jgi:hypothetical protein